MPKKSPKLDVILTNGWKSLPNTGLLKLRSANQHYTQANNIVLCILEVGVRKRLMRVATNMEYVTLDQIQTGMVVEENVVDKSGRMLLPAGKEITEKHLKVFKTWGVTHVAVGGGESKETENELVQHHLDDPESPLLAEAKEAIEHVFSLNRSPSEPVKALKTLCTERKLAQLVKEAGK